MEGNALPHSLAWMPEEEGPLVMALGCSGPDGAHVRTVPAATKSTEVSGSAYFCVYGAHRVYMDSLGERGLTTVFGL